MIAEFDFNKILAERMELIKARHPRMALPIFAAALANRAIQECMPALMRHKNQILRETRNEGI